MVKLVTFMCISVLVTLRLEAVTLEVKKIEKQVGILPIVKPIIGETPREILKIQFSEAGKTLHDPAVISTWILDPSQPKKGLLLITKKTALKKSLQIKSLLFNGWAQVNRLDQTSYFYHLLEKKMGPTFEKNLTLRQRSGDQIIGELAIPNKNSNSHTPWIKRIVSYNPTTGIQQTAKLDFIKLKWMNESSVLGVALLEKGLGVVNYNPKKNTFDLITTSSPKVSVANVKEDAFFGVELFPAGANYRDGIYAIYAHDLWYLPRGNRTWRRVVRDLYATGANGGIIDLPVRYLGNHKFAVSMTIEAPKNPQSYKENTAVAVTLLIDGMTGRKIDRSKLFTYQGLPHLEISSDWWAKGSKPTPKIIAKAHHKKLFLIDQENHKVRFTNNKIDKVVDYTHFNTMDRLSSRRYLLLYQCDSKVDKHPKSKCSIRLIDGKTGEVYDAMLESKFDRVLINTQWLELQK